MNDLSFDYNDRSEQAVTRPTKTHEVLIVDDQRTFADALALAIDTQPGMRTWPSAHSAEEAIELLRMKAADGLSSPDVVLLDINLPGMDGITAISELRATSPHLRIIVLTADLTGEALLAATDAGADALLPKDQPFGDVLRAIRDDLGDDMFVASRTLAPMVNRALAEATPQRYPRRPLTEREYEILLLLADGTPVKQIARRLEMSIHTCRGHVSALLGKLDAHSQLAAVVTAARLGLLPNLHADG